MIPSLSLPRVRPGGALPSTLGFRMPAEWEPHRATWLVWPHNRADWEVKMSAIEWCYVEIIKNLLEGEEIAILFKDGTVERRACSRLRKSGVDPNNLERYHIETNRSWIRDFGPLFVVRPGRSRSSRVALTDWHFNGWSRYRAWQKDDAVPRQMAKHLSLRRFQVRTGKESRRTVVLEGGSVDVNGRGLLLATEECLLGSVQARNPGLTRELLEQVLMENLGVERVLWLAQGIVGDDTNGHVDDVARFISHDTVAVATEKDTADENYASLKENLSRLKRMTDIRGRRLRIVSIPMPTPRCFDGERLPASYLNFYIGNRKVLVPTFNDPNDRIALERLAPFFPGREVVGIHSGDLILGLGSVHCLTQQEPLGRPN